MRLAEFAGTIGDGAEEQHRLALLRAGLATTSGEAAAALEALAAIPAEARGEVAQSRSLLTAQAMLMMGDHVGAASALADLHEPAGGRAARQYHLLRAKVHLATATDHLGVASEGLEELDGDIDVDLAGQILMTQASHDMSPDTVEARRVQLDRAARKLTGYARSRAADLRDCLVGSPTARLEGLVALMEAVRSPEDFPGVLADVVAAALGAHRVLIMVRIPGLGRRVTFHELTDSEAAGLSVEVMRRIRFAGDVWLEDDAVGDPHLRSVSETVRTMSIRSVLAVAIPLSGRAGGALYVDDIHRRGRFGKTHAALLKRLAAATAGLLPLMAPSVLAHAERPTVRFGVVLSDATTIAEFDQAINSLRDSSNANLLLTGATGTGKTWLARALATQVLGLRGLVEATMRRTDVNQLVGLLSGTRRGDFTGAVQNAGLLKICVAENKALFLDEIQALSDDQQVALLPLLELPVRRFGGLSGAATMLDAGLTIILGTNAAPSEWRDHFREDFWFRIGANNIHLPELHKRGADAVRYQLALLLAARGLPEPKAVLSAEALDAMGQHPWPGNVRQLSDASRKIAQHWKRSGERVGLNELSLMRVIDGSPATRPLDRPRVPGQLFLEEVLQRLPAHDWNQSAVARELGTIPSRVHRALKRAGLLGEVRLKRADAVGSDPAADGPRATKGALGARRTAS